MLGVGQAGGGGQAVVSVRGGAGGGKWVSSCESVRGWRVLGVGHVGVGKWL